MQVLAASCEPVLAMTGFTREKLDQLNRFLEQIGKLIKVLQGGSTRGDARGGGGGAGELQKLTIRRGNSSKKTRIFNE